MLKQGHTQTLRTSGNGRGQQIEDVVIFDFKADLELLVFVLETCCPKFGRMDQIPEELNASDLGGCCPLYLMAEETRQPTSNSAGQALPVPAERQQSLQLPLAEPR